MNPCNMPLLTFSAGRKHGTETLLRNLDSKTDFPNNFLLITSLIYSVFIHGFFGFFDYLWLNQNGTDNWLVRD
jgi:hypothetical protein